MRVIVYTAIFGGKDNAPTLNRDAVSKHEVRFVCITDNPNLKSDDYEVIIQPIEYSDITKNARKIKVTGFKGIENYDVAIWHDSSIEIDCSKLDQLIEYGRSNQLSTFHHPRNCTYLEAIACIDQHKDHAIRITIQMFRYFLKGLPTNSGLNETTVLVTRCKDYMGSELQIIWWNEILNWSRRDQLSLSYARWLTGSKEIGTLEGARIENPYTVWKGHKHETYTDKNPLGILNSRLVRGLCKKLIYYMRRRR
ncbi:MAG TPA: hypothetical protein DCR04_13400 [Flavobacteriales bacterium]|nr:hypothetical protein [Flavobacteriales bacterium]